MSAAPVRPSPDPPPRTLLRAAPQPPVSACNLCGWTPTEACVRVTGGCATADARWPAGLMVGRSLPAHGPEYCKDENPVYKLP